jgi:hypothetical protein
MPLPTNSLTGYPSGIALVVVLMILFGVAEVITGFTHNFIRIISTSEGNTSGYAAAAIGACYTHRGFVTSDQEKTGCDNFFFYVPGYCDFWAYFSGYSGNLPDRYVPADRFHSCRYGNSSNVSFYVGLMRTTFV